jgi:hypothetical protein
VYWELSSNHPEFERQTQMVLADGFAQRGFSWSGGDVLQFPNQVERPTISELEAATATNAGVKLLTAGIDGMYHGEPSEIKFSVRVHSEGPACVSATAAQSILVLGGQRWLQPYAGGGKYDLQAARQ